MLEAAQICVAVIDDDESFCRSSSRWLQAIATRPTAYSSAEEFLADPEYMRFDCLLVDVQLGGMSGLELQQRLNERHAGLPIIFITAHDDPQAQRDATRAGCTAYLRKTDDGALLLAAIRRAVPDRGP
jgi:FixJ family two-component response regulator